MTSRGKANEYSRYVSLLRFSPVILFRVAHRHFKKRFDLSPLQLLALIVCHKQGYLKASELHSIGSGLRASNSYLMKQLINDGYLTREQHGEHHGFRSRVTYYITGTGAELVREFNAIQSNLLLAVN